MTVEHPEPDPAFVLRLLHIYDKIDCHNDLFWRTPASGLNYSFFVNCSDLFWWGTADLEEITPENVNQLEEAIEDICAISKYYDHLASELFAARVRKQRPQGAWYQQIRKYTVPDPGAVEPVLELFNACGPEREQSLGNPKKQSGVAS